ncbi:unnamed protein product [Closterium sp. NIES-54]
MVTRRLLPCYTAGGVPVSAALLRTSPSACGTNQVSGTRCCLSARSVSACLASAMCCRVPFAADRATPATHVLPRASLLGAPAVWESMAPLSFRHRAPAAVLANACRRRSSLPVPVACRTGENRPRAILRGASPCPASANVLPSPYRAVSALVRIDCLRLLPLAPAVWSSPRAAPPHGCRLDRAIPAAGSSTLRPPPGLSPCALPPAGFPPRPFPLIASHPPLPPPPPRSAFLVPLHLLLRPAPASVPGPPSPASPLRERRHYCSLPVRGVVPRILANDLSHRGAVRDLPVTIPCVFLGFPVDYPDFEFYHPPLHRFLDSRDVRFDESVFYYAHYPCRGLPLHPPPLFLAPSPPASAPPVPPSPPWSCPVRLLWASGGVGAGSAAAGGTQSWGASLGGAGSGDAGTGSASLGGAGARGAGTGGASSWGAGARGAGTGGASSEETGAGGTTTAELTVPPHRYNMHLQALRWLQRKEQERLDLFVSRVLATLVTNPRASPSSVSALTAAITDFAATSRLDYATRVVVAPPPHPLSVGVYGLRSTPREWHDSLRSTLRDLGFRPSSADPSPFVRAGSTPFFIIVYVDDLVFATSDRAALAEPFESSSPYAELVGCLMYLITCTRLDLAFPLSVLSRFVATGRHRTIHWTATVRVVKYLATTSDMGLVLGGTQLVVLTGHCDSSYADDVETQRSTQGYYFSLGAGAVSWRSMRSLSVASFSAEAEIYAGAMAAQQLCWLTFLLTDLGEWPCSAPTLFADDKVMILLCREPRLERRLKHIDMRYFFLRELQRRGHARLDFVASEANTTDVFTKALAPGYHHRFSVQLGLVKADPRLV